MIFSGLLQVLNFTNCPGSASIRFATPSAAVRDLGIFLDSDMSMSSHVKKALLTRIAMLRQLRSICRSVVRPVVQSLETSLALSRLDYGNATLAGIPQYLLRRLQSVMNAAAWLIYSSSRFDRINPLLHSLHWLKAKKRIDFKLAVLVFKCVHGSVPPYLADDFSKPADSQARCQRHSASSSSLVVRRTRLTTVGDQSFPVAASRVWNDLPQHVIASLSLRFF